MSDTGTTLPDGFIEYVTKEEVVGELNLNFDKEKGKYIMYNVSVLPLTISSATNFANVWVNSLVGDARTNPRQFARSKILARQMAALRVAVISAGGWVKSASDYSFSGLSVGVGSAARNALEELARSKKVEIDNMLLMVQGKTTLEEVDQSTRDFYARGPGSDYII